MEKDCISWNLSLRVERPIEGCELSPHPYLKIKAAHLDNQARAKILEGTPHLFSYKWSRGLRRQICENHSCPRGDNFDPICWSRFALGGPGLQCMVCYKAGIPRHQTIFCSTKCFKVAWKEHSQKHKNILQRPEIKRTNITTTNINSKNILDSEQTDVTEEVTPGEYIEGISVHDIIIDETDDENHKNKWTSICEEKCYTPVDGDVGCSLRIECHVKDMQSLDLTTPVVIYTEPVLAAPKCPPKKSLITVPGAATAANTLSRLRVVSYNILAEVYATRQVYPYCDAWNLVWPYRRALILQEIEDAQADIICLQEVQADYYESQLVPALQGKGYEGLFKQKTRESMGASGKVDGCAVFWKGSKLTIIENYAVEFNECARRLAQRENQYHLHLDEHDLSRLIHRLSKDNIAQMTVFELNSNNNNNGVRTGNNAGRVRSLGSQICIINTHLYANPKLTDVKLWQTLTLLQEIENFISARGDLPYVLCGDFNSEPDSAVYQLLAHGQVDPAHTDFESIRSNNGLPDPSHMVHNLGLKSAMMTALGAEPTFTNYTAGFVGTLDYIWYSHSRLRVLAVVALPDETEITATGEGLPSANRPSDHLMLCADLILISPIAGGSVGHTTNGGYHQQSPSGKGGSLKLVGSRPQQQGNGYNMGGMM